MPGAPRCVDEMDILLVTRRFQPAPGGAENQVSEIARRLTERSHRVVVFTTDLYRDVPFQRFRRLASQKCGRIEVRRYRAVPIPCRRKEGTSLAPSMLMSCLVKRNLPRIVHCHGLNLATVSALSLIQRRTCKTLCTTHHDPCTLSGGFIISILKRFDGLVALSEIERKRMLNLGLDGTKIRLIPNGIDIAAFKHLPHRESFRRRMGIQNHLILYAGRIDTEDKGCDVLVEAVSIAQHTIGDCTLVFSGPDWGSQEYLQTLSVQRKVRAVFTGTLDLEDLKSAFVACDVFVLPSVREAVGLSIIEAMLCGAPVVATRVGGIPSLVQDEETGLLVSPRDPRAMAEAICRIIQDRRLSTRLAARGRELGARYSIDSTVTQLERFYDQILQT